MEGSLIGRTVAHSRTEQVQILMQGTLNGYNRLFGGKLMEWIDVVAAVTARRHCGKNVTTAAVDSLVFKSPAMVNDTILLEGHVTYAGRTSMEVCVTTYVEELSGFRREINKAYLVLVAIDADGKPTLGAACNSRDRGRKTRIRRRHGEKKKPRQQKIIPPYRDSLVFYSAQSFMMFSIISADFSMPSAVMCS